MLLPRFFVFLLTQLYLNMALIIQLIFGCQLKKNKSILRDYLKTQEVGITFLRQCLQFKVRQLIFNPLHVVQSGCLAQGLSANIEGFFVLLLVELNEITYILVNNCCHVSLPPTYSDSYEYLMIISSRNSTVILTCT